MRNSAVLRQNAGSDAAGGLPGAHELPVLHEEASPVKALFNSVLISGIVAFMIAQLLKPLTNWCVQRTLSSVSMMQRVSCLQHAHAHAPGMPAGRLLEHSHILAMPCPHLSSLICQCRHSKFYLGATNCTAAASACTWCQPGTHA